MEEEKFPVAEQEQPVFEPSENGEDLEKKRKREAIFELALFLVLGILLGITIKTEAVKKITIGFNDYKITAGKNSYDVEEIRKRLEQQAAAAQQREQ